MLDLAHKRVLVVGLGISGMAAARALARLNADVRVTDAGSTPAIEERAAALRAEGIEVTTGGHEVGSLDHDLAVVSPGIPPSSDIVRALRAARVDVTNELEIGARLARCDLLAVTGTNGKTTTTTLLASMLDHGGIPTAAAGNIGLPLTEAVVQVPEGGAIAVEVSSFQLDAISSFRPRVAVLLNIAEDHTDWHGSFDSYAAAKARIVENQTPEDVFVCNLDDHAAAAVARRAPGTVVYFSARRRVPEGIGVDDGRIVFRGAHVMDVADVALVGVAGLEDTLAAAGAALSYGVGAAAVAQAARSFRPLAHRLQVIARANGITYIDDSKATNPCAALSAVRGLRDVVLIAGGRSKGIDLSVLRRSVPPVRAVVALGEAAAEVEAAFAGRVPVDRAATMDEAVRFARARAAPGGSVLLSPGCASLDMYESYARRGDDFARAVDELLAATED